MFTKKQTIASIRFFSVILLIIAAGNAVPVQASTTANILTNSPGSLDTTFDGDGLVTTSISNYADEARAVTVQGDGKIVIAGRSGGYGDVSNSFLARYNADGSLDTSFGNNGIVVMDFAGGDDGIAALAIQSDQKILATGYASTVGGSVELAVARYNTDGTLDAGFGLDGKVITVIGNEDDYASDIVIQPDNRIVVVGGKNIGTANEDIALVRYHPDGSLDATFGLGGIVVYGSDNNGEIGASVDIQQDGKLVVGGYHHNATTLDLALSRFNTDGSPDASFGSDGMVITNFVPGTGFEIGGLVALQPDGKILLAGAHQEGHFLLARYLSNGSLDVSFGTNGLVLTPVMRGADMIRGIALQVNGKIVLAGYSGFDSDFGIARYNSNGSRDGEFGTDGLMFTDFGSDQDDIAMAVTIQTDGRIVAAGYRKISGTNYDVAVARYLSGDTPQIRYVKYSATGLNDGTSWANAYTSLQSALAAASSGDEIWVAKGTYKPTLSPFVFELKNGVAVYGGFAGTETNRSQRDNVTNSTVLSGDLGVIGNKTDNAIHVVVSSSVGNSSVLDGFTITEGNANLTSTAGSGGGMSNNNSSPTLSNLIFINNSAVISGGGIFNINGSSPTLKNVLFQNNSASSNGSGGAMENEINSSPSLENVTFANNSAGLGGAITNANNCSPTLVNVTFTNNTAVYGGGMINRSSTDNPILTNVTFSHNSASDASGAIGNAGNMVIKNSIFWGDTGGEIFNISPGTVNITNSIVQGGYTGAGNLNVDPLLSSLASNGGFTKTMALGLGSPAIDTGNDIYCPATDQRGVTRPLGSHCDIGAYEYDPKAPTFDWNTFQGGALDDSASDVAIDPLGNVYITGKSNSAQWEGNPINPLAGGYDAFAAKFNPEGQLLWYTFLGSAVTGHDF
ncbi:MAG: choice-of-anchor Q domain-containing protein [Anaerolineales bacterium]